MDHAQSHGGATPDIVLDVSRLLSRVMHATPTGVDRCEMAYARTLHRLVPERLSFAAVHPIGVYARLPTAAVLNFLDRTEERWADRGFRSKLDRQASAIRALATLRPQWPSGSHRTRSLYLQASPNNLTRPRLIRNILQRENASLICLVHDLIPLEYPEYGRADGVAKHLVRVKTIADHADGIVANSHATMRSLLPWLTASGRTHRTAVAHLGTSFMPAAADLGNASSRPYFACIGTIEPRKNHLLLLHVWRQLSERMGADAIPKLIVIGRRGWENEQVVDMLERCPTLRGCVEEHNGMSDGEVATLLRGARALLMPSFAEGYGMPVAEALAAGIPVICSDLPALREASGEVADFLDPLDGPAWTKAVMDFAATPSPQRATQQQRIRSWRAPSWDEHIGVVLELGKEIIA